MLKLTLDIKGYTSKPAQYTGIITNRIAKNICTITEQEFCNKLEQGYTWCPGIFASNKRSNATWLEQSLFAVDIDGGNHSLESLLTICETQCIEPLIIHESFSSCSQDRRWRVIFKVEEPVYDGQKARAISLTLASYFNKDDELKSKKEKSDADKKIADLARLLYGTNKPIAYFDEDAVLDPDQMSLVQAKQILAKPRLYDDYAYSSVDELPQHIAADLINLLQYDGVLNNFKRKTEHRHVRLENMVFALMKQSYMTPELACDIIDSIVLQDAELHEQFVETWPPKYEYETEKMKLINWGVENIRGTKTL